MVALTEKLLSIPYFDRYCVLLVIRRIDPPRLSLNNLDGPRRPVDHVYRHRRHRRSGSAAQDPLARYGCHPFFPAYSVLSGLSHSFWVIPFFLAMAWSFTDTTITGHSLTLRCRWRGYPWQVQSPHPREYHGTCRQAQRLGRGASAMRLFRFDRWHKHWRVSAVLAETLPDCFR